MGRLKKGHSTSPQPSNPKRSLAGFPIRTDTNSQRNTTSKYHITQGSKTFRSNQLWQDSSGVGITTRHNSQSKALLESAVERERKLRRRTEDQVMGWRGQTPRKTLTSPWQGRHGDAAADPRPWVRLMVAFCCSCSRVLLLSLSLFCCYRCRIIIGIGVIFVVYFCWCYHCYDHYFLLFFWNLLMVPNIRYCDHIYGENENRK